MAAGVRLDHTTSRHGGARSSPAALKAAARIEAQFLGLTGRQVVTLQDLSATGAKIRAEDFPDAKRGILSWMHFEVFGEIKWRRGAWVGMVFDRPISLACLLETRSAAPGLLAEERRNINRHARDFVDGR